MPSYSGKGDFPRQGRGEQTAPLEVKKKGVREGVRGAPICSGREKNDNGQRPQPWTNLFEGGVHEKRRAWEKKTPLTRENEARQLNFFFLSAEKR